MNNPILFNKLLYVFCLMALLSCQNERPFVLPEIKTMNEAVYTSVVVIPQASYQVFSPVNGLVESIEVAEGDTVKAGQTILHIKDTSAKYNAASGKLNVELARVNLESQNNMLKDLENEMNIALTQLKNDSSLYVKQKNLWDQNVGSKNELDQRLLNYKNAKERYLLQRQRYNRTKEELEINLAQSKVQLQNLESTRNDYTIKSNLNGLVYAMNKEAGESVTVQEPLAEVGSADAFKLEMEVDEVDISKIKLGDKVYIKLDAFGDIVYEGALTKIYPKMNTRTQAFKVEADFEDPPSPLYPGLSGEANILIDIREDVLVVPSEYVNARSEVETEEGVVPVEVGIRNLIHTEIRAGIDSTTKIFMPE